MSVAADLAKEMNCKVQDVKAIAKRLNIDLEMIQPEQNEGLSEAIALFLIGKTIEEACASVMEKAKTPKTEETPSAIAVTQSDAIAGNGISRSHEKVPMPDGLKKRIDTITTNQAVEGAPETREAIAETLSDVSEETLQAIKGYTAHSYQEALMHELNKPEFLDDLEKTIKSGKSQT